MNTDRDACSRPPMLLADSSVGDAVSGRGVAEVRRTRGRASELTCNGHSLSDSPLISAEESSRRDRQTRPLP
ncbi:hypothetical protein DPEC_G00073010 [Dallia pectoralis]|uniref:Uncharacterized protein n=1 Tax=Dallia pectoralis TaxID=75939 RepID=A0ACC2H2Y1_DALPE|nr:hypothetical protein DPEC_G00073010 [Dallia pectoralis]